MTQTYGYIRVSSRDQNEARQRDAMKSLNIPDGNIFLDRQSGRDFDRPRYRKLIETLKPGDLLCVSSIDRLGRNYREILDQWRVITREKGAHIAVLDMPLLDTRIGKDLTGLFMSELVLQILSFVAEKEREAIGTRQAEGIAAAKRRGVRFGRPKAPLPGNFEKVLSQWKEGLITGRAAAKACGMPLSTFRSRARELCAQKS